MSERIKKMKPRKAGRPQSDRRLAIGAVVAVTCVALALGIVFFTGSSEKQRKGKGIVAQTSAPTSGPQPTGSTPATPQTTLTIEQVEVPPLSIYRRRNPFKPLVNMNPPVTVATTPTGTGASGPPVVMVPPQLQTPGSTDGDVVSRAITLEGVFEGEGKMFARIRVADRLFEKVGVGDTFADNYKLLAIGKDPSATILYGDERFTVFVGQSIYW